MLRPFDPSAADTAAGLAYRFDVNGDGHFEPTDPSNPVAFLAGHFIDDGPATVTIRARVTEWVVTGVVPELLIVMR